MCFDDFQVSLPTGLGKTFIAAVIMYNFYRWYPLGKIVFMAPTRPLVAQQIDACYNIVAIPRNDTIEMTGKHNLSMNNPANIINTKVCEDFHMIGWLWVNHATMAELIWMKSRIYIPDFINQLFVTWNII